MYNFALQDTTLQSRTPPGQQGQQIALHDISRTARTSRTPWSPCPGMVCYAEKEEKTFWFNSLGQMSQLGTIYL